MNVVMEVLDCIVEAAMLSKSGRKSTAFTKASLTLSTHLSSVKNTTGSSGNETIMKRVRHAKQA